MKKLLIACALLLLWSAPGWAQPNACPPLCFYPQKGLATTGGTLTGPLLLPDGTAALPGIAFASTPTTGFYFGSASIQASIAGVNKLTIASSQVFPAATDAYDLGTTGRLFYSFWLARGTQGAKTKALTDAAAATAFMTAAVPTNGWAGGELVWTATSLSGADQLTTQGRIRFAGATTAATPVCTIGVVGTDLAAVSGGANTLICTWTNVVAAQTCALSVTCTNNLAGTQAITMNGRYDMPIANTVVFP